MIATATATRSVCAIFSGRTPAEALLDEVWIRGGISRNLTVLGTLPKDLQTTLGSLPYPLRVFSALTITSIRSLIVDGTYSGNGARIKRP